MTGESDERRKEPYDTCMARHEDPQVSDKVTYKETNKAHILPSPLILSGTSVAGGTGRMLTTVVGDLSALGEILLQTKKRD